jgi:hypothetical protein
MKKGGCEYYVQHCVHYSTQIHDVEVEEMRYGLRPPVLRFQHSRLPVLDASRSHKTLSWLYLSRLDLLLRLMDLESAKGRAKDGRGHL